MHKTPSGAALGLGAVAVAAALWAAAASVASRLFDEGVAPLELVEARAVVAALGLALVPASWRKTTGGRKLDTIALGLAIALVNLAYYIAIDRLAVAVAIVLQYSAPLSWSCGRRWSPNAALRARSSSLSSARWRGSC